MNNKFLLQSEKGKLNDEEQLVKGLLDKQGAEYIMSPSPTEYADKELSSYIPIGSIQFVEEHLNKFYGIPYIAPIELPKFLRLPHLLQRKYDIIKVKDLPTTGTYFLKSAQHLKTMQYCGFVDHAHDILDPNDWCVISDIISPELIESEFRIFVYKSKVQAIKRYTYTTSQPPKDFIAEVVELMNKNFPINTYSFDIGYIDDYPNFKPFLIEVHLCTSLGTYGFKDSVLLDIYQETYNFLKTEEHKKLLETRYLW